MPARDYQAVTTQADLDSLLTELKRDPSRLVAFDVETGYSTPKPVDKRALDIYHPDFFVVGFSITNDSSWARYIPLRHDSDKFFDPIEVWEKFRPVLEQQTILAHHKKFEDKILRTLPLKGDALAPILTQQGHDSMIAAYVSAQFKETGLKYLTHEVLGEDQSTFASLFAGEDGTPAKPAVVKRSRFNSLNPTAPHVVEYACDDASLCLDLFNVIYPTLEEPQQRIYGIEMAVSALMAEAEEYGVGVAWADMQKDKQHGDTFRPIYDAAVREHLGSMSNDPRVREKAKVVNFGSSPQMRQLLYEDLGLTTTRTTGTGALSTDAQALESLSRNHVGVRGLLSYRETSNLAKRLDKWLGEYSGAYDGRVHATFAQTRVVTGRFSAKDPALQQLGKEWLWSVENDEEFKPIKTGENGKDHWAGNFREFLAAGDGRYLLSFDYSQLELRVLAGVTQDPTLLNAFATGVDPHTATAAMMLGIPIDQVGSKERAIGKTCNFAILYQMGPKSLAERLAITKDEAVNLMDQYFAQFQNVDQYISSQKLKGVQQKHVTTWLGRKVPLFQAWSSNPGLVGQAERLAVNAPIQGGGADYVKLAMLRSKALLQSANLWSPDKVMMTMNQHDALTFEVNNSVDPNVLKSILQQAVVFDARDMFPGQPWVPAFPVFEVDWEMGLTWGGSKGWEAGVKAVWDDEHQQWVLEGQEPVQRRDTSPIAEAEPEQVTLSLEPVEEASPAAEEREEFLDQVSEFSAALDEEQKILRIQFEPTERKLRYLRDLLLATRGPHWVELRFSDDSEWQRLDGGRTFLTEEDADRIRLAVPDAVVKMG